MEDSLLCSGDDFSDHSDFDSDAIDSETEAELYSAIHYAEDLQSFNSKSVDSQNSEFVESNTAAFIANPSSYSLCTQENAQIQLDQKSSLGRQEDSSEENQNSSIRSSSLNRLKRSLKRKSDSVDTSPSKKLNSTDVNKSITCKSSADVLMKTGCSPPLKQSPKKKNSTVIIDSDSDDSIIWTESHLSEKSEFTTNLSSFEETILLSSSDSECELPPSLSFRSRQSILKNQSMPNIKMGEETKGQWHINDEDLYRQRKFSRRYHETIDITCTNCNKKGHNFRICPVPKVIKCFICGGAHLGTRCGNRICINCLRYGHHQRRCPATPNHFFCEFCNRKGHAREDCYDLWRRYHLTTKPMNLVLGKRLKQDSNLWCWNCGRYGHFGAVCEEQYTSRNHLSTWPCVVSYDCPKDLLRRRLQLNAENNAKRKKRQQQRRDLNIPPCLFERKNMGIKQRNELNIYEDFKIKIKNKKKGAEGNQSKKKRDMNKSLTEKIVREKDFARTPRQKILEQIDETPESVELLLQHELKLRKRNMKRHTRRQMQKRRRRELSGQNSIQPTIFA